MSREKNRKVQKSSRESFRCSEDFSQKLQKLVDITGFDKSTILQAATDYFMNLSRENQVKVVGYHMICEALRLDPGAIQDFQEEIARLWPAALPVEEKKNTE